MADLENTSQIRSGRPADPGRLRHPSDEMVPRHRHAQAFAAVVLSGRYIEAGDTGRHAVAPGDVLFHKHHESHSHQIGPQGAEVFVLAIREPPGLIRGRIEDPDAIVRLCETEPERVSTDLVGRVLPHEETPIDWPDVLARDLLHDPFINLTQWAEERGLHPGSISRGFRKIYSVTPVHFRLVQRTHRALSLIRGTNASLAGIAIDTGFADQPHMTRAITRLTARSARNFRNER